MADRDTLLAATRMAAAEPVMLISGITYWLELPSVAGLLSRGVLAPELRNLALRFASEEGIVKADLSDEDQARWDEVERVLIADSVRAIEWTCPCETCGERRQGVPGHEVTDPLPRQTLRYTPDDLAPGRRQVNEVDYEQLQQMVLRIRSPRQVDAMSRLGHGQMSAEDAAGIVESERINTLAGWVSFRGRGRGPDGGDRGQDVGGAAVEPRDHLGPGGRVRGRRRSRQPAAAGPEARPAR